jgi:SAM-dependent methyltransferase
VSGWDTEYETGGGVPSSYRDEPSGAVVWALERVSGARGLDVGCGTGRNTLYAASRGLSMVGFDRSPAAIARARARDGDATFLVHDLIDGLPVEDGSIDVLLDIFVYKHVVHPEARLAYRDEMYRVLAPGGHVVIHLAEPTDGYYGACPLLGDAHAWPHAVLDPVVGVGSVLFTLDELRDEFAGFGLVDSRARRKDGDMHGAVYERHTLTAIFTTSTPAASSTSSPSSTA